WLPDAPPSRTSTLRWRIRSPRGIGSQRDGHGGERRKARPQVCPLPVNGSRGARSALCGLSKGESLRTGPWRTSSASFSNSVSLPDDPLIAEACITPSQISPGLLIGLLSAGVFLVRSAALMLGPLLVVLAAAFNTSVAAAGQLAAAINLSWAITALFVGPVSDTYSRRRVGLTGLLVMGGGILGSIVAWNYWALLVCRLLTGVGAAMIPPNSMAIIADHFPPAERGRPISILISASFLGPVLAIPLVALLADLGGWRAPFGVVGGLCLILWGFQWLWLPQGHTAGKAVAFLARFATLSRRAGIWHVLVANALYQTAAFALFTYLAAFLIRTYGMRERETALPLAVALLGAMLGSILGGSVAGRTWRIGGVALTLLVGGLFAAVVFVVAGSPWLTVLL